MEGQGDRPAPSRGPHSAHPQSAGPKGMGFQRCGAASGATAGLGFGVTPVRISDSRPRRRARVGARPSPQRACSAGLWGEAGRAPVQGRDAQMRASPTGTGDHTAAEAPGEGRCGDRCGGPGPRHAAPLPSPGGVEAPVDTGPRTDQSPAPSASSQLHPPPLPCPKLFMPHLSPVAHFRGGCKENSDLLK